MMRADGFESIASFIYEYSGGYRHAIRIPNFLIQFILDENQSVNTTLWQFKDGSMIYTVSNLIIAMVN
jgi:hypothetical protein